MQLLSWRSARLSLVALVGLSVLAPFAGADSPHGDGKSGHMRSGMGHGRGHFMGTGHYLRHLLRHQDALGLTDEQVTKLKEIQLDFDRTRIRTEAEILVAERELASLVHDEKTDLSTIETKLKQQEGLETSLRLAAIKARRDAVGLLNPDQRKKEQLEHERMLHSHGREGTHGTGHRQMRGHGTSGAAGDYGSETRQGTSHQEGGR